MTSVEREKKACLGIDPFWSKLAMLATQDLALKRFFRERIVLGQEYLPLEGPVILAPTHRSRWDALLLPMAAGRRITKRDCHFMVTVSEMKGLQGWFLNRLGCFAIDQSKPSLISLRYSIDLLMAGQQLVLFPEGRINRSGNPIKLEPGLARLSQISLKKGIKVSVLPIGIAYSEIYPKPLSKAAICFQKPLTIEEFGKDAALEFNSKLSKRMNLAEGSSLKAVGRIR